MSANLSPEYIDAEKRFRAAKTPAEKLGCLKEMLSKIPKHKGTEKMQAGIKRKISKFNEQVESQGRKKGHSYKVNPEGAGQIVLVGPPNVGKSALLDKLTNAEPEVAEYPFTTRIPIPGMMPYLDISVQMVDLPPVSVDHTEPWLPDILKASDGVLLMCDISGSDPLEQIENTISIMKDYGIYFIPLDRDFDPEVRGTELKTIIVANKFDRPNAAEMLDLVQEMLQTDLLIYPISTETGQGIEEMKKTIFELLDIIRVYSKQPGKDPDMKQPFTVPRDSTLMDFAEVVHKDFVENLKYARVWGSGKFDGQVVKQDHVLQDKDIVELHI